MVTPAAATQKRDAEATKTKKRDAEATKRRILESATAEFGEHGIAGARVDRIASAAGANKSLIYAYFGNKDRLFDAVFDAAVTSHIDQVPIDVDDLPGYATRLYDYRLSHPKLMRLADWDRLERDGVGTKSEIAQAAQTHKVKAIARAQKEGKLPTTITAEALLEFVLAFCQTGLTLTPNTRAATAHRKRIAAGVAQLVEGDS